MISITLKNVRWTHRVKPPCEAVLGIALFIFVEGVVLRFLYRSIVARIQEFIESFGLQKLLNYILFILDIQILCGSVIVMLSIAVLLREKH
jgi:hypothetical protein